MAASQAPIDSLTLHPDAAKVPMADRHDLDALRTSLAENGQQDPIDTTPDGVILDGRTRWTLLRELGALSVQVRVVDLPTDQQTGYIVDRALSRRHLTAEQKQALNALLRTVVVEEVPHPKTGEIVRVGRGQADRARTLGVNRATVQRWDAAPGPDAFESGPMPTHIRVPDPRLPGGVLQPAHLKRTPDDRPRAIRPAPKSVSPPWRRHYTRWCRGVLPEDRAFLRQMSIELHDALRRLEMQCEPEG